MKNLLKMQNFAAKKAEGSIETAIKVLTAVVLGALVLAGLYIVVKSATDTTSDKVASLFEYSVA